jgi:hypothetical protein
MAVETAEKCGVCEFTRSVGKGGKTSEESTKNRGKKGGGEKNAEGGKKTGSRNPGVKCGDRKEQSEEQTQKGGTNERGLWRGGPIRGVTGLQGIHGRNEGSFPGGPPGGQSGGKKTGESGAQKTPWIDDDVLLR